MKSWFIIILLLPILLLSKTLPKTEIIIFGTVHEVRENFDIEDGLNILEQVKPDVILLELPISDPVEKFPEIVRKTKDPTQLLEGRMIKKYLDKNPSVPLRYFDIENRNKYYIENRSDEQEQAFQKKLEELVTNSDSDDSGHLVEEEMIKLVYLFNFDNILREEYPRAINSTIADSIYATKHRYLFSTFLKFTETIPALKQFKEFWVWRLEFWHKRNKAMAKNIINYAEEFQGKRIIVITGSEHRYYLRNELKKSQKQNFVLKEYWEYEQGRN
jgi:vacuolar-type H+-ATPase subunit E/Vma4